MSPDQCAWHLAATEPPRRLDCIGEPSQPARTPSDSLPRSFSRAAAAFAAVVCSALAFSAAAAGRGRDAGEAASVTATAGGLTVLAADADPADVSRNMQLAPICFKPLVNVPGVGAVKQGNEILSRKFATMSECSLICTQNMDNNCNSFTFCSGWQMCFLKDKTLEHDDEVQDQLPGECMSFRAVPCMLEIGMKPATVMLQPPPVELNSNRMIFYMYRAQTGEDYPLENVNAADLAGLMWYLHSQVLQAQPRKYNITRILRFKVAVKNPSGYFGKFMPFEVGKCVAKECDKRYKEKGFEVGCRPLGASRRAEANYARDFVELVLPPEATAPMLLGGDDLNERRLLQAKGADPFGIEADGLQGGLWFSLPEGGNCRFPTGEKDCTYSFEAAGEISLDELSGILDPAAGINTYEDFWKNYYPRCLEDLKAKKREGPCEKPIEYDFETDKGVRCNFWDQRRQLLKCQERMEKVRALFAKKYPAESGSLGSPSPEMCPPDATDED